MEGLQRESFDQLLQLSDAMCASAYENVWEEVVSLELKRQSAMKKCFVSTILEKDSSFVAQVIKQVLEINQQLALMCSDARQCMAASISQENHSKSACDVYAGMQKPEA